MTNETEIPPDWREIATKLEAVLRRHHEWHQEQTDLDICSEPIQLSVAEAYTDSSMYEDTSAALSAFAFGAHSDNRSYDKQNEHAIESLKTFKTALKDCGGTGVLPKASEGEG